MRLSACMIVRDEEAMLPRCLESFAHEVDEIIVVDTGSTDRTIEIVRSFGAHVIEWRWRDDFAAARNVSLEHATGDWCLLVDADNVFPAGEVAKVRRALERPQIDARRIDICAIEQHEAETLDASIDDVLTGSARAGDPNFAIMLARRAPHIRYRGIVHETLEPGVREGGGRGGVIRARVVHYGSIQSLRDERRKDARNEALLRRRLAADPTDIEAAGYLAIALLQVDRPDDADEAIAIGWRALLARPIGDRIDGGTRLAVARAIRATIDRDWDRVLDTIAHAVPRVGPHPDLGIMLADALAALDRIEESIAEYDAVIAQRRDVVAQTMVPGAREWRAPLGKARALFTLRRHDDAIAAYDDAIAHLNEPSADLLAERRACELARDIAA